MRRPALRLVPIERFVREPEPVGAPRPHDFAVTALVVVNTVTGERRELDPRAWARYVKERVS
jgi:hypothetical protein